MSLTRLPGVWQPGVWNPNVWADGVWYEAPSQGDGGGWGKHHYGHKKYSKDKGVSWLFRDIRDFYIELIESGASNETITKVAKLVKPYTKAKVRIPKVEQIDWWLFEKDAEAIKALLALWTKYVPDPEIEKDKQEAEKSIQEINNEIDFVYSGGVDVSLQPYIIQLKARLAEEKAYLESILVIEKAMQDANYIYMEYTRRKHDLEIAYIATVLAMDDDL